LGGVREGVKMAIFEDVKGMDLLLLFFIHLIELWRKFKPGSKEMK
jgi:hypothetical protein